MTQSLCLALSTLEGVLLSADEEISRESCHIRRFEDRIDSFGELSI